MANLIVKVLRSNALSAADKAAWAEMRAANPALYSPYFHPDYTSLIGDLRDDAHIAAGYQDEKPKVFFPFQGPKNGKSGFARPIGAPMTDYHGFIHHPDFEFDRVEFLNQAGIGALHYWAMVGDDSQVKSHHQATDQACVLSLAGSADDWRAGRDSSYRRHLKSHRRRVRKAEKEIGPRRFEYCSQSPELFETLIRWKREKFLETGKYDVLSAGWTLELLRELWGRESGLRCDMQVLYFGDEPAAIDLGLSDGTTFHSWIVGYDNRYHTFGPGIQLLEGTIDGAQALGYARIDLGVGLDGYKRHYASDDIEAGSGFIAIKGPAAALSQVYGAAERLGQKALKDAPGKLRRRYSQIADCDDSFSGRAKAMLDAVRSSGTGQ